MRLYHGSEKKIEIPSFGQRKKNNDYGMGFYCTENIDLAREWAVDENRDGYANIYNLDMDGLVILDLNGAEYSVLHWIALLLANREFELSAPIAVEAKRYLLDRYLPNLDGIDVVKGYRADDSYFAFARDFVNNTISVEQLSQAMQYGDLGEQIVLKSEKSFEHIRFIDSEQVDSQIWYPRKEGRDSAARLKYYNLDKRTFKRGETYILNLLDKDE